MPDKKLIYAEDLQKAIVEDKQIRGPAFAAVMRHLSAVPAVEARPVVHGRWLQRYDGVACMVCCAHFKRASLYCPNCGADMRGAKDGKRKAAD